MKQLKKAIREVAAPQPQPAAPGKNKSKNARKKLRAKALSSGVPGTMSSGVVSSTRASTCSMTHREYLGQLVVPTGQNTLAGSIVLEPYSFAWLGGLSKCFEKYQWVSLALDYIPDVGTTKDGSVAWGIDWGSSNATLTQGMCPLRGAVYAVGSYDRASVVALTPSAVVPLWKPNKLVVPSNVLQTRKWYSVATSSTSKAVDDFAPGSVAYFVTAAAGTVGDVWATYRVNFAGTRKP